MSKKIITPKPLKNFKINSRNKKMFLSFLKKRKVLFYLLFAFFLVIIFFTLSRKNSFYNISNIYTEKNEEPCLLDEDCQGDCETRLIDGILVERGQESPMLISAIIDNHSGARPQFSLSLASLVYDIPAEGGINRYLAFFRTDIEEDLKIGPIRSARPYFLDISKQHNALLLHCGGSPEALARIIKEKHLTLNEFYNEKYFERYSQYKAPHNILAKFNEIKDYLLNRDLSESIFDSWKFKESSKTLSELDPFKANLDIEIKSPYKGYDVKWEYDLSENLYVKKIAGNYHLDNLGNNILANNLILQFVDTQVLDSDLRLKIDLDSGGRAVICMEGYCSDGTWSRNEGGRIFYYQEDGDDVVFNPGKTWVIFVNKKTSVLIDNYEI
jgi:hypothetical protein